MDSSVSPKDEILFLRVYHHISTGLYSFLNSFRSLYGLIFVFLPFVSRSLILPFRYSLFVHEMSNSCTFLRCSPYLSPLIRLISGNDCYLPYFFWCENFEYSFSGLVLCWFLWEWPRLSLTKVLIFSVIFFPATLTPLSPQSSKCTKKLQDFCMYVIPWRAMAEAVFAGLSQRRPGFDPGSVHVICLCVVVEVALGKGFSRCKPVFPCQYHSANALYSISYTCCSYQKDKRAKPGNLWKSSAVS